MHPEPRLLYLESQVLVLEQAGFGTGQTSFRAEVNRKIDELSKHFRLVYVYEGAI